MILKWLQAKARLLDTDCEEERSRWLGDYDRKGAAVNFGGVGRGMDNFTVAFFGILLA